MEGLKRTFVLGHLGLGDHILTNGLVRGLLAQGSDWVIMPVRERNVSSVRWMFHDILNKVGIIPVDSDDNNGNADAIEVCGRFSRYGDVRIIKLGGFAPDFLTRDCHCDEDFYRQAGVGYHCRFDLFHVPQHPDENEVFKSAVPNKPYVFVHDDSRRGYTINLATDKAVVRPVAGWSFWAWRRVLLEASEIHCIDSSFMCWIDSMNEILGCRLVWHRGARAQADHRNHPLWRRQWEVAA